MFTSLSFICFLFPITLFIYYFVPKQFRQIVLLIASILFLMGMGVFCFIFYLVITFINYICSKIIFKLKRKNHKTGWIVWFQILLFTAVLYFWHNIDIIFLFGKEYSLSNFFPIGISFVALQCIEYSLELQKNQSSPIKYFHEYMLFVLFFPHILRGPIYSYKSYCQMQRTTLSMKNEQINMFQIIQGIELFIYGLAKKLLLSDKLGFFLETIRNQSDSDKSMFSAWLSMIAFGLQLYYEFSGYADMAEGLAYCFGYKLPKSYRFPMFSDSLSSFSNRWNITAFKLFGKDFSSVFKNGKIFSAMLCVMIAFILIGAWYGMKLTYLLWGVWIGVCICIESIIKLKISISNKILGTIWTVFVLTVSWAFFSSDNLTDAFNQLFLMFGGTDKVLQKEDLHFIRTGGILLLLGIFFSTEYVVILKNNIEKYKIGSNCMIFFRAVVSMFLFLICISYMITDSENIGFLMKM